MTFEQLAKAIESGELSPVEHVDEVLERLAAEVPNVLIGGVGDLANIARLRWPLAGALRLRGRAVDAGAARGARRADG